MFFTKSNVNWLFQTLHLLFGDTLDTMHENTKKLIDLGQFIEKDGYLLKTKSWGDAAKFDMVANMTSTKHGVIVVGQPKTGNHLCMSILDCLGCDRAEEIGIEGGINSMPFEDQPNIGAYARMEEKMKNADNFVILPHAHIQAR